MEQSAVALISSTLNVWAYLGLIYAGLAVGFMVLKRGRECNPNSKYWKKENVLTDALYWFVVPLFSKYVKLFFLFILVHQVMGLETIEEQKEYFEHGYGPLAELPVWLQACLIVIIMDVILYWTHRLYHSNRLWKFHAIHHSSEEIDWPSAYRFHPINSWTTFTLVDVCMVAIGFAPEAFVILAPFNIFYSAFVHANLNWTLGPFKTVLASPVFHRWHHTHPDEGGSKNFAPTFPVLDIIFGTFYMPKGKLPEHYGVTDKKFPVNHFIDQLFYPFRK